MSEGIAVELVMREADAPWVENDRPERKGFFNKHLGDGLEGRPRVHLAKEPPGADNPPHFHTERQFQIVLEGKVKFSHPEHVLTPISVHYTDANTPYGPFQEADGMLLAVLRPQNAGIVYMSDREQRGSRDPLGRELFGISDDVPWEKVDGSPGTRSKYILGRAGEELYVRLWESPSARAVTPEGGKFGLFVIVLRGSLFSRGIELHPYSMIYRIGGEAGPLQAGPQGATWLAAAFDNGGRAI